MNTLIVPVVSLIIALGLGFAFTYKKSRLAEMLGLALLGAACGFVVEHVYTTASTTHRIDGTVRNYADVLLYNKSMIKALLQSNTAKGALRTALTKELAAIRTRLDNVAARQELEALGAPEVVWLYLVDAATTIRATNIVKEEHLPEWFIRVQRHAIENRGAMIQRIMIPRQNGGNSFATLASRQSDIGIDVKLISDSAIDGDGALHHFVEKVGSKDFVIFDDRLVFVTKLDEKGEPEGVKLVWAPEKVEQAKTAFNNLWSAAKPFSKG